MDLGTHRPGHKTYLVGATGGSPERAFQVVCSCGAQWASREGDPRWPTLGEWYGGHRRPLRAAVASFHIRPLLPLTPGVQR